MAKTIGQVDLQHLASSSGVLVLDLLAILSQTLQDLQMVKLHLQNQNKPQHHTVPKQNKPAGPEDGIQANAAGPNFSWAKLVSCLFFCFQRNPFRKKQKITKNF